MQNIQNVHNSTKLSTPKDQVVLETYLRESGKTDKTSTYDSDDSCCENTNTDEERRAKRLEREANQKVLDLALEQYASKHFGSFEFDGTHRVCCNPSIVVQENHLLATPALRNCDSVILDSTIDNIKTNLLDNEKNDSLKSSSRRQNNPTVVRVVLDMTKPLCTLPTDRKWTFGQVSPVTDSFDITGSMDACIKTFGLDDKQTAAFNIICSSFMLVYLLEQNKKLSTDTDYNEAIQILRKRGANDKLFMFLSGPGGGGKSYLISAITTMCQHFCAACGFVFNSKVLAVTASTNTAAADIGGSTIHTAAQLRKRKITVNGNECEITQDTKAVIIDEISMLNFLDFGNTDKNFRKIFVSKHESLIRKRFGGVLIIVTGDFFQLNPVRQKRPLFAQERNALWREINEVIFLNGDWRFQHDPEWGKILGRLRLGLSTDEDFETINSRVIGKDLKLPTLHELGGKQISYACSTNRQRNIYSDKCFLKILETFHPRQNDTKRAPEHTIIVNGIFSDSKSGTVKSKNYHYLMYNNCGDDNIETSGQYKRKVDPCLKLTFGCQIMVSDGNDHSLGFVKGTTASFVGITLKEGCTLKEYIYDGFKVNTIDSTDVEYMVCERNEAKNAKGPTRFKLYPQHFNVDIKLRMNGDQPIKITGTCLFQFPINIDTATTVHKLQGKTKESLVVTEFNYKEPNWIYVVLSRLISIIGLYLLKPLEKKAGIGPSEELIQETIRLEETQTATLTRLQNNGFYPVDVDLLDDTVTKLMQETTIMKGAVLRQSKPENVRTVSQKLQPQKSVKTKRQHACCSQPSDTKRRKVSDDNILIQRWLQTTKLKRLTGVEFKYTVGNCLYDSLSYLLPGWSGRGEELRYFAIDWAQKQIEEDSEWAITTSAHFIATMQDSNYYGMANLGDYLAHQRNIAVYATDLDLSILNGCFRMNITIYSVSFSPEGNKVIRSNKFFRNENYTEEINLWYDKELQHYEPIIDLLHNYD